MYYSTRNRRRLTFETLMTMPSEPESKAFYTYLDGDDRVEVLNDTFTLVLSRDVRKNARIAAEMAFQLAKERPQDDVLYVNTYAGVALMKEAFSKALEKSGLPTHPPLTPPASGRGMDSSGEDARPTREEDSAGASGEDARPTPANEIEAPPPMEQSGIGGGRGVVEPQIDVDRLIRTPWLWRKMEYGWDLREDLTTEEERAFMRANHRSSEDKEHGPGWLKAPWKEQYGPDCVFDDEDEEDEEEEDDNDEEFGQEPSVLGNLFIHDVPFGTWDTSRLERDIEDRGRADCHTIVVLNSFEFASMGREQKSKMAKELLELRSKLGLSFLIFSHDLKRDLAAGLPCRGALGIISANAGSVQRLNDPFENLIRHRKDELAREKKLAKRAEKEVIHEAQMRNENYVKRGFYLKVPEFKSEYDKERWMKEQKELPDYHVDPWLGKTQKTGRELLMLARSSILQRYFEKHADYLFTKGYEPTEYELVHGTYEAKEVQKKWFL
ncbi:MAG: hypothetical protein ACHQNE_02840 [Candidatus Kapaibacterium sp.]